MSDLQSQVRELIRQEFKPSGTEGQSFDFLTDLYRGTALRSTDQMATYAFYLATGAAKAVDLLARELDAADRG
jgi:hypothetical protein